MADFVEMAERLLHDAVHIAGIATHCALCGDALPKTEKRSLTTGYGVLPIRGYNFRICYKCCGDLDIAHMKAHGRIVLYLTHEKDEKGWKVGNWPDSLEFDVIHLWKCGHNWAGFRRHFTFIGPDGKYWYGDQYGNWSEIAYCYRYKNQPRR